MSRPIFRFFEIGREVDKRVRRFRALVSRNVAKSLRMHCGEPVAHSTSYAGLIETSAA